MSTAVQIQQEVNTLSADLQKKVLAYVEWLKYRDLVREVAIKSKSLGGIETLTEEDNYQLFEEDAQGTSIDNISEKTAIAARVAQALERMRLKTPSIPNDEMINRAKKWRKL